MNEGDALVIHSFANSMLFAGAAVVLWYAILKLLDRGAGRKFRDVIDKLHDNSLGLGIYYGLRALAVAYLIASVLQSVRP